MLSKYGTETQQPEKRDWKRDTRDVVVSTEETDEGLLCLTHASLPVPVDLRALWLSVVGGQQETSLFLLI